MSEGLVCPRVQCCTVSLLLIITEEIITLTLIAHLSSPLKGLVVVLRADKSILFSALNKLMKTLDLVLLRLISVTKTRNIPPTPSNNHQQDPDSDSFFFLSAELANSLEPSNGRGPFVRELIKHSSQKNTKYRDSIDDDSKLTICPFTVRLVHSMPKDTLFE